MLEEHFLHVRYFENNLIEEEDIQEALEIGLKLSPSEETKMLVEVERYVDFTTEAREFAQNQMRSFKAEAHVFPSLANQILFNFFIKFRKNDHPLKAFSSYEKAYKWLSKI